MRALVAILLATMFLAGTAAADDRCRDEYGRNLCDPVMRAEIRARFGVPPAEELAARGVEGVRIFLIDGYSNDRPLVTILREPGAPPTLEVRAVRKPPGVISAPATAWQWSVAETLAGLVRASGERPLAEPSSTDAGSIPPPRPCLHAWVTIVEAIKDGRVTMRIRSACGDEPIYEGAASLTAMAVNAFRGCSELKVVRYGGDAARLEDCTKVEGRWRLEAVTVLNRLQSGALANRGESEQADLETLFAPDATLAWYQEPGAIGRVAAAARWRTKVEGDKAEKRTIVVVNSVRGEDGTVRVTGVIREFRRREGQRKLVMMGEAPFTQDWKLVDRAWRIVRWDIGALEHLTE